MLKVLFVMNENTKMTIAFYDKYLLTVEEAAVYFHIGNRKMRSMIKEYPGAKWETNYDQEGNVCEVVG